MKGAPKKDAWQKRWEKPDKHVAPAADADGFQTSDTNLEKQVCGTTHGWGNTDSHAEKREKNKFKIILTQSH